MRSARARRPGLVSMLSTTPTPPPPHQLQLELECLVRHGPLAASWHHQREAALQLVQGQAVASRHEQLLQLLNSRLLVGGGRNGGGLDPGERRHVGGQQPERLPAGGAQLLAVEADPSWQRKEAWLWVWAISTPGRHCSVSMLGP